MIYIIHKIVSEFIFANKTTKEIQERTKVKNAIRLSLKILHQFQIIVNADKDLNKK